ncbi:paladin [Catharus ustulatus]|uniref:Paladin n=1 Tax=Catharus ustulatus TaxID=91951 RepID=A0A8C3XX82_CATUS|nr:paladin [Catharus ustulatus]XP_032921796.1 paladin [Catharus ustulatus]XP_032921797.1 paladin [Catharus ustulatus]XP_032921798.1 paladin [Catharus ustulatus]
MMGTTASAAQQAVSASPLESRAPGDGSMEDQHSLSIHSFQTLGLHNSKAKSIITNKVAPVVITYNCREEFQIHDDLLKANYTVGRISEATLEHYLVQGKYFMVRDVYGKLDVLNTTGSCGAPNFRQAKGGYAVFGMGQPSLNGFKLVLQKLQREGHKECVFFCVREEPVVFLRLEGDFVSYTPRDKENLHENLQRGVRAESLELAIRKEIRDFAQLSESVYYVYNDIERLRDEPHAVRVQCDEDIQVTDEVYRRPVFLQPSYRYHRLPLPAEGAPLEEQFDAFIRFLRESPSLLLRDPGRPPPALLFGCQTGVGRTNLAMAMGTLVLHHHRGAAQKPDFPHLPKTSPRDRLRVIQTFMEMVPKGQQIVEEVDGAIASCSEMHDMKEAIYEYKKKLEGIGEDYQIQGSSTKEYFLQRTLQSLERYFYLIAFNYYLHEQYPLGFALSFSRWMCRHPELYRLQADMNCSELTVTAELVTKGTRVLVADERFCPDVLSTAKEMSVANFRRVPKMPIYGTAQPSSKTLGSVLRYLTDAKRKHSRIVWINLREEAVLEGNEQIYTLREPGLLEELIPVPAASPQQLEKLEAALKGDLQKCQKWLEVYLEAEKQMKMFKSCLTTQEIFSQQKNSCQGLTYRRIPIPDFCAPKEQDFDRLLEAMKSALAEDSRAAFVFNCCSGRGRTTTAMVIAVLTLWHFNGIPEMSEEEIVSVPDAKYTKGEFEVVMKVVQLLPDGHRMKKEVDMALDTVSETMTPMHYHLREIIICTYRQGKSSKDERETRMLQLRSLQYLERYIFLILFNSYLHLEKKDSWQRPFSLWMREVAAVAGVYEVLNQLGFPELESLEGKALCTLRGRWQAQGAASRPFRGDFV